MWHNKNINITLIFILTLTSCYSPKVAINGNENYKKCYKISFLGLASSHFSPFKIFTTKKRWYYNDSLILITKDYEKYSCACSTIQKQKIKNFKTGAKFKIKYLYDKHGIAYDKEHSPVIFTEINKGKKTILKCDSKDLDCKKIYILCD